jgi:hypothetical protein
MVFGSRTKEEEKKVISHKKEAMVAIKDYRPSQKHKLFKN